MGLALTMVTCMVAIAFLAGCNGNDDPPVDPLTISLDKGRPEIATKTLGWAAHQAYLQTKAVDGITDDDAWRLVKISFTGEFTSGIITDDIGVWVYLYHPEKFDKVYQVPIVPSGVSANGLQWVEWSTVFFGEYRIEPELEDLTLLISDWWVDSNIIMPQCEALFEESDEDIIRGYVIPRRAAHGVPSQVGEDAVFYIITNHYDYYFNGKNKSDQYILKTKP